MDRDEALAFQANIREGKATAIVATGGLSLLQGSSLNTDLPMLFYRRPGDQEAWSFHETSSDLLTSCYETTSSKTAPTRLVTRDCRQFDDLSRLRHVDEVRHGLQADRHRQEQQGRQRE